MDYKFIVSIHLICAFLGHAFCKSAALRFRSTNEPHNEGLLNPIIFLPGDGGSQFEAKLDKPRVVHYLCDKKTNYWFPLWLSLEDLLPIAIDCFVDNMNKEELPIYNRLTYDPKTHTTQNQPGVQTRQPGFGNTSTVEWLDSCHLPDTFYFHKIVERLVQKLGYVRNKSVRGAPYDFRKAPNDNQEFLQALRTLVEQTYAMNNKSRVVLFGHSMGNPYIYYFLRQQPQAWKDKYIKSFIALSAPWGGAVKLLRLMASGDDLGAPLWALDPLSMRAVERTFSSSAWLMPSDTFWNDSEVLATGPKGNYTVKDYKRFFDDINHPTGYLMWQDTEGLIKDMAPPGVDVHCIHGSKVNTPAVLHYSTEQWHDKQPDVTNGPGDGTVNLRSLYGCLQWVGKQGKHNVIHKEFSGSMSEHIKILDNEDLKSYLITILGDGE